MVAKPKKHVRVITGPLSTGELAVVVYNKAKDSQHVIIKFSDIKWNNSTIVRDLYEGEDLGRFSSEIEIEVKGQGVRVFRFTK